jgi:hypothetical protein
VIEGEEGRAPRRRSWLRRVAVVVVFVALVATIAAGFRAEMRETNEASAEVDGAMLATRVERIRLGAVLVTTRERLQETWDERTVRHAQRVALDERLKGLYGDLLGLNDELADLVASSQLHVLSLAATKRCLLGVHRAIEQVAVDDNRNALATLDSVRTDCERARAAGRSS